MIGRASAVVGSLISVCFGIYDVEWGHQLAQAASLVFITGGIAGLGAITTYTAGVNGGKWSRPGSVSPDMRRDVGVTDDK